MTIPQDCNHAACLDRSRALDRRAFLRASLAGAGLAAGLSGLGSLVQAAGGTDALLLSCMDYRLMDDVMKYMRRREMTDKYDHVVLAGASLGAQTSKYPDWGKTFWDHLAVALELHHIRKVIVMDHRDCGAYKVILGKDFAANPKEETAEHTRQLRRLERAIRKKHPKLSVDLLLMNLDGKVEMIP